MSKRLFVVEDNRNAQTRSKLDPEVLVELVWLDLKGQVPRSIIERVVNHLLATYKEAKINTILPIISQQVTKRFFREKM